MMLTRTALALSASLFAAPALAQDAVLTRTGGIVGGPLEYRFEADPGALFGLALSTQPGPTPLAIFDANDPRVLAVGLDLVKLWQIGVLDPAGEATLVLPVPMQSALQGLVIHAQMVTLPGATTLVGAISAPNAVTLGAHETSVNTPFPLGVALSAHTATALSDGDVLIAGGVVDGGAASAAYRRFDHQAGRFVVLEDAMEVERTQHTATRLADGRVLTLGGSNSQGAVHASGEILDPLTGVATPIPPMSVPRVGHTATLLPDGRVFVAGGTASFDFSDPLGALGAVHASTAIFDPATLAWSNGPNLPKKRALHAATLTGDGKVLITGGIEITNLIFIEVPEFSSTARRFDPATGTLLSTPSLSGARAMHGQVLLSNGDVLVAGGVDGDLLSQTFTPVASTRRYVTATNSWTSGADLAVARVAPGLFQVGSDVLAIGGLEAFDLVAGTGSAAVEIERAPLSASPWTTVATTAAPRFLGASAPVGAGGERILSTGTGDAAPVVTGETYVP